MAVFSYHAQDPRRAPIRGTIVADSPRHARDLLRERGLSPELVKPRRERSRARLPWIRRHEAKVVEFVRELATLLAVGVRVLPALDTIAEQQRGRFRAVVLALRDRISSGTGLGEAMRQESEVFDELVVGIVEVGERSGTLGEVLERLADFKERSQKLRGRVGNALIYPAIVLSMALVISLLLMTFVVPNILKPLVDSGADLPLVTVVVKGASDFLIAWWWALLVGAGALSAAFVAALRSEVTLTLWHRFLLRLPLLGSLLKKQAVVRIAVVLSTLLRSGVVFLEALRFTQRAISNRVMREALTECESAVASGRDLSSALESTDAFPPAVVQVFSLGQESGNLDELLERLSESYDRQVYSAAQRLTALFEPAMILALAVLVGFIAFATILPILEAGHVL